MIYRQGDISTTTILASMSISAQDVLTRQNDLLEGDTNVDREANDAWKWHRHRNGMQRPTVRGFDQLSFPEKQKDDSLFYVADAQGLVIVIQNEHFTVHFSVGTHNEFCCGEG